MVRTRRTTSSVPFSVLSQTCNDENLPPRQHNDEGKASSRGLYIKRNWASSPGVYPHQISRETGREASHVKETPVKSISPGLQKLIQSPGRTYQTQQLLMQKHHDAKSKAEERFVGGGISIWPEMNNMRLTFSDLMTLVANSIILMVLTYGLFTYLHGTTLYHLNYFIKHLKGFPSRHPLETSDQMIFVESVLRWHKDYSKLLKNIDSYLGVSWETSPSTYPLAIFLYILGIAILLFYLYDSVFSKSRLTPQRIKQWVCLLVILMTWTILMLYLLLRAQKLENTVKMNVHFLNGYMEELVLTELDLSKYESVLHYWTTMCLLPSSEGLLTVLGIITVQNLTYYLIYYSVPIVTALFTPILQLIISLHEIYKVKPHPD